MKLDVAIVLAALGMAAGSAWAQAKAPEGISLEQLRDVAKALDAAAEDWAANALAGTRDDPKLSEKLRTVTYDLKSV